MSNKKLLLAAIISVNAVSLAACNSKEQTTTTATATIKDEISSKYLACYALESSAKNRCIQDAGFEAEKLGFKQFLQEQQLPCESIHDGPLFAEEKQAYLAKCSSGQEYFLQFNYENNQWKLVEDKNAY